LKQYLKSRQDIKDGVFFAVQKKIFTPPQADRFDHDLLYSKGGTSLTAANVRILCMKHNLKKSDKILSFPPISLS
jgi:hypothetical protein